jgi:glutathione S-transferase
MIDLHYAPTPNGWKISIMLEEFGLPYQVIPVNIRSGEQFRPEFLAISPNNRIPAIVDHAPADGGGPFSVFETGAILIYLAELGKTGAYVAGDYSIADIACFPWTMTHKAQGFTLDHYPNIKRWYAEVRARPQVQAGLAIGKFVKEPFDEEARRNMFGQKAKEMAGRK